MSRGRYASRTSVGSEKTRGEIERILRRYGAGEFAYGWKGDQAVVGFELEGRKIRFQLTMSPMEEFAHSETGRERSRAVQEKAWEQAQRQRWRALKLVIQAKLEAVDCGISTIEDEFLAFIVLPGGRQVRDHVLPEIEAAYQSGKVPRALLPAVTSGRR